MLLSVNRNFRHFLLMTLLFLSLSAYAQIPLPALTEQVVDLTGTLSQAQKAQLITKLSQVEQEKGSQVVVLILPTTKPEDIAQFGIRLADSWKIGRKGVDDGVILIVAKDDRELRIEVGYGLEGAIPDAAAKRIIEDIVLPEFRSGNFFQGIDAGTNAIIALIKGEPLPVPKASNFEINSYYTPVLFFGLVFSGMLHSIGLKKVQAASVMGVAGSVMGLILSMPVAVSIILGLAIFFMTFIFIPLTSSKSFGKSGRGSYGGSSSGWSSGGGWSGGGGGGFGGGGASGRW